VGEVDSAWLGPLQGPVKDAVESFNEQRVVSRIWRNDPSVWGGTDQTPEISDRLGWLDPFDGAESALRAGTEAIQRARQEADRVVLLGMGGSSLAPEVMWNTIQPGAGPRFSMLDTTSPDALSLDGDLSKTWFVVSSKSGSTLETKSLFEHFWAQTDGAGDRFVIVTDPGSNLEATAQARGCAHVFLADPEVGGRFSALTPFGLAPMAMAGLDAEDILRRARPMAESARCEVGPENPAGWLGAVMAEAVRSGRDKLGLVLSEQVSTLGLWLEQLIAESTGKGGTGLVPVVLNGIPAAEALNQEWLMVSITVDGDKQPSMAEIASAGHPVVQLQMSEPADLGAEFYRWEFATAVAGSLLGLNPFDQPNVTESKAVTNAVLSGDRSVDVAVSSAEDAVSLLRSAKAGNYVALLSYAPPNETGATELNRLTLKIQKKFGLPATWGFGPRYLHSTGQLHKGGPATGVFIQQVQPIENDRPIPGAPYSFGEVIRAQADGDYACLEARDLPIARIGSWKVLDEAIG
jgi:transaldolase/glucose-6-phosphate isomerase